MNCSPLGSSVHGILPARILEWVAMPFSRGSSWPRDPTHILLYLPHWQEGSLPLCHLGRCNHHGNLATRTVLSPKWSLRLSNLPQRRICLASKADLFTVCAYYKKNKNKTRLLCFTRAALHGPNPTHLSQDLVFRFVLFFGAQYLDRHPLPFLKFQISSTWVNSKKHTQTISYIAQRYLHKV